MHGRLTLRLDEALSLLEQESDPDRKEITPRIRSLLGALAGVKVSESDYKRHLEAKHR